MDELLTAQQVAALMNCSDRMIRKMISEGKLPAQGATRTDNSQTQYRIPLSALHADLQLRYHAQRKVEMPAMEPAQPVAKEPKRKQPKPPAEKRALDEYTAEQREQIALWTGIVEEWISYRSEYERQTDADRPFAELMRSRHPGIAISVDILYRRRAAYLAKDMDGLIDRRGGWNAGTSSIPDDAWSYFLYVYLDDRCLPLSQCYDLTVQWAKEFASGVELPHEQAFRRRANQIEKAVVTLGRGGLKKYEDRCAPYITRLYDDLHANDYWVADNHTLDIISKREDGSDVTHRLSLTAMIDARSGVIVGWNLTDNPCSQSTVLALRHAISRFGIPHRIYVDNGSEFLTHDIGGRGHRSRKSQSLIDDPPPIFKRLGIEMTNAIVKNAKAKPIERTFGSLKGLISRLFTTFTGGNIMEKPESLKATLKKGEIPLDGRLRELIGEMIDGVYNVGAYGGSVVRDRGKSRIDVWNESIATVGQRMATEADLALMLMRSTRVQKIGRKGVSITICGEKLEYYDESLWPLLGQDVYVRYDPANLASVRLYDAATDKFMSTVPMALTTMVNFSASSEEIAVAQEDVRRVKKAVKGKLAEYRSQLPANLQIDALDLRIREAHSGREGMIIQTSSVIVPIRAEEKVELAEAVGGQAVGVVIDMQRMNRNAEARRERRR